MIGRRTKGTLLNRLERLELRTTAARPCKTRMGHLHRLPQDYRGERHVIVAKLLPNRGQQEWVEFEEVPGPRPDPPPDEPQYRNIIFVPAYAVAE
ncbi:MAG: hypothetical protein JWP63_4664 [Candidatus Solibacter sp.]|nr:hypothetical protein [Candidatus Solibacter sp.]